uniref:Endonuclease/exonuclease/phosphatase domain-containing protein n=1 Tax=Plectus sambesii TaxID=2011161 RepID=A0A914XKY1_9BILA
GTSVEVKVYSVNVNSLLATNEDKGKGKGKDKGKDKVARYLILAKRVARSKPHAILVQETKLDEDVKDSDVEILGYQIYRLDRSRHGGGVAIYVRSDLEVVDKPIKANDVLQGLPSIEAITLNVLIGGIVFSFTSAYRPQPASIKNFTLRLYIHCLMYPAKYRIVAGDLNSCLSFTQGIEAIPSFLLSLIGMRHTVKKPTHKERIIDQVFIPKSAQIIGSPVLYDPIEANHKPVYVRFRVTDDDKNDANMIDLNALTQEKAVAEGMKLMAACTLETVAEYMKRICFTLNRCAPSAKNTVIRILQAMYKDINGRWPLVGAATGTAVGGAIGGVRRGMSTGQVGARLGSGSAGGSGGIVLGRAEVPSVVSVTAAPAATVTEQQITVFMAALMKHAATLQPPAETAQMIERLLRMFGARV